MKNERRMYAVLTGDIVDSSKLTGVQLEQCLELLRTTAQEIDAIAPNTIAQDIAFFRGDAWQVLLGRPEQSLRAALLLRCALKMAFRLSRYDTRIAIGIGQVEALSKRGITGSRGPAFTLSGAALDQLDEGRMALRVAPECGASSDCLGTCVAPLLDGIVGDWTPTEARAVHGALHGWTQLNIAKAWPGSLRMKPTRQAVQKALARAHWDVVKAVLAWFETTFGAASADRLPGWLPK